MKLLRLIPALVLTACATHVPRKPNLTETTGKLPNAETLRTSEQLKEYRFGRYVDPSDPLVMHESHPVYRVESSAGWNLTPGDTAVNPVRVTANVSTATAHDAIIAEVNKQQAATRAFTDETAKLNERLSEMSQAVAQTRDLAKQNLGIQNEIAAIRDRLDALDSQIHENAPAAPNATPAADKW